MELKTTHRFLVLVKKLIFGGSTAQISETSNVLYYGVSKVIKVPAAPSQLASNMKERQQETPPPVVVEQKKVEEPTRQVASQEDSSSDLNFIGSCKCSPNGSNLGCSSNRRSSSRSSSNSNFVSTSTTSN